MVNASKVEAPPDPTPDEEKSAPEQEFVTKEEFDAFRTYVLANGQGL